MCPIKPGVLEYVNIPNKNLLKLYFLEAAASGKYVPKCLDMSFRYTANKHWNGVPGALSHTWSRHSDELCQ